MIKLPDNPDDFICVNTNPDTHVQKLIRTNDEYAKETDFNEGIKYSLRATISKLEQDLIYYSREGMEVRMEPNTIENIVHDLKIAYKLRNKVYCRKNGEYYFCIEGLRRL